MKTDKHSSRTRLSFSITNCTPIALVTLLLLLLPSVGDLALADDVRIPVGRIVLANASGISSTFLAAPGDSGGPLVNLRGKVIGIATGYGGVGEDVYPTFHTNASALRSNQLALESLSNTLETEIHTAKAPHRTMTPPTLSLKAAGEITVQILSGENVVALGPVVNRNGLIVTKLSELKSEVAVALSSKEIVAAQLIAKSTEHELALLRVDASGLGRMQASAASIERGMLVVSVVSPAEESTTGMVGDARIQEFTTGDQNASPEVERTGGLSKRRSGFRRVFVHDCAVAPNECGGPLTTIDARVRLESTLPVLGVNPLTPYHCPQSSISLPTINLRSIDSLN